MNEWNIVNSLHTATKRDYLERVNSVDKAWAAEKASTGATIIGMAHVKLDMAGINMTAAGKKSQSNCRKVSIGGWCKDIRCGLR